MHFQQHIHELKESRVIATLWACINRRLKQHLDSILPRDTIHNLEIYSKKLLNPESTEA